MAAADSFLRDVLAALRRVSEPPELKEISRLAISIHEQGRVFPWMSDLVKRSCEAAYLAQSANLRQREDLEQTLNDIDAFVAQSRDSRVSRVLARWFYGHQIKRYNESLRSFILQDFCEKVDQYGAPEVCTEKNPSQFVPLESPADRIDSGVQENHNTTAMGHEPTSSEKPHPTVGSRSSTMASSLDVGLGSNSSSSAATPPPRDRICSSPIPVGPEDTPSDPGSSQSFQCEGNEVDTMQARLDTPIGRDNRGRICLPSLDGYASEAVQEVADLIQEEIQTKAVADADYRKECTKHLKGLFKTHRVLPTSLFVNDVVRPKDKSQPVGGGGFSDIYTGLRRGKPVCLKVLRVFLEDDTNKKDETIDTLYKEAVLWTQLKHPNVLPFLGVNKELFTEYQFCMVSPWMVHGSILQFLKKNPSHDKLVVIREIASGIAYLHSRRVVHGDIKPANILVDENGRCHLADFGLAAIVSETATASVTDGQKGTLRYMAPESILSTSSPDERTPKVNKFAADIYAYGCTVLEIITGQPPFSNLHDGLMIIHIMNQLSQPGERPTGPGTWCPDNVWTLIEKCWNRDRQLRPQANRVQAFLEHIEELRRLGNPWDQTHFDSDWREPQNL